MKRAVVLFNLGGPDCPEAVEPFLTNLFSDPAVLRLPGVIRKPLARLIAHRRAPIAREIYAKIGGRSPILEETEAQAKALEQALGGGEVRVFVAMRCWKPFIADVAAEVAAYDPGRILLVPLYPQYSTTTSGSALQEWRRVARTLAPTGVLCNFATLAGFIDAMAAATRETLADAKPGVSYRLLLSAHGLPKRIAEGGDPYQKQVEATAAALASKLGYDDWVLCYQSKVGPLEWIGPATDAEIRRAGAAGKGVVIAPIAFVSEHSETLVELDIEYAHLAHTAGVPDYRRVPTVGVRTAFIDGLAALAADLLSGAPVPRACSLMPPFCPGCSRG